jgi:hypothetical protein
MEKKRFFLINNIKQFIKQAAFLFKVEFNVHKFVLMTNSDVFHAMFSHENTKESREGRIIITDSTPTAVRQMLHYMYAGALPKNYDVEKDSAALIKIADKYEIKPLMGFNEHKLIGRFVRIFLHLKCCMVYGTKSLILFMHIKLKLIIGNGTLKDLP